MLKEKIKDIIPSNFTSVFFAFTFFYSVIIYVFAISFYFWLLRDDIKPEK